MSRKDVTKRAYLYVLDERGNPKPVLDPIEWSDWWEHHHHDRLVAKDWAGQYRIMTIFLGMDPDGWPYTDEPRLWETTRFIGQSYREEGQWRYTSKTAAIHGHQTVLEATRRLVERGGN